LNANVTGSVISTENVPARIKPARNVEQPDDLGASTTHTAIVTHFPRRPVTRP
jgi:hypothetical protein